MRVIERQANAESYAREIVPPVADGLVWWGNINDSAEKARRNLATAGLGSIVGAPVFTSERGRFDAPGQYLSAGISETDYMTFCFAGKAVSDPTSTANAPVFAGNYNSSPSLAGLMMWFTTAAGSAPLPAAALRFTVVTGTTANQCALQVANADQYHFYIGVVSAGQVAIYNMTDGTFATLATSGARMKNPSQIRIGSNASASFGGIIDLAAGAIYSRPLNADERAAVYAYWKDVYLADRGIVV